MTFCSCGFSAPGCWAAIWRAYTGAAVVNTARQTNATTREHVERGSAGLCKDFRHIPYNAVGEVGWGQLTSTKVATHGHAILRGFGRFELFVSSVARDLRWSQRTTTPQRRTHGRF